MLITIALAAASASASAALPATLDAWVAQVNSRIEKRVRPPLDDAPGLAAVSFRRDETGRPVDIRVQGGSMSVAQAAIRVLHSMGTLPPMPAGMPSAQRITFKFLVGRDSDEAKYQQDRARLFDSANRTNMIIAARLGSPVQVAALDHR